MALAKNTDTTSVEPPAKKQAALPVYSVTPFTMLDFPERTACVVWFSGCNMRCAYCHNPELVKGKGRGDVQQVIDFLEKRKGLLDGVVLSGGEASVYPGLPNFIKQVKQMGYAVKLDTNGLRPEIIEEFLLQELINYVALDFKAPPHKFKDVTGVDQYNKFSRTLDLLCAQKDVEFEVRTTVHTDLMNEQDVNEIIQTLDERGFTGNYYVQNYKADNDRPTLGNLAQQKRELDITALTQPKNFTMDFRNF